MPFVVSRFAAAINDVDSADEDAGHQIAWFNTHPRELGGRTGLAACIDVNCGPRLRNDTNASRTRNHDRLQAFFQMSIVEMSIVLPILYSPLDGPFQTLPFK